MNNKEFISALSGRTGMKIADTQKMIDTLLTSMGDSFLEGDSVQVTNLGTFEVKKKMERVMVNPASNACAPQACIELQAY